MVVHPNLRFLKGAWERVRGQTYHHRPLKPMRLQRQRLQCQELDSSDRLLYTLCIGQGFLVVARAEEEGRCVGEGVDPCYIVIVASWPAERVEVGGYACAPGFERCTSCGVAESGEDCAVGEGGRGCEESVG